MTNRTVRFVLMAAMLATGIAGCGGDPASRRDKAGGAQVTTLTLGTPDPQGRPASDDLERFAQEVAQRSSGRLRIEIAWEANVRASGRFGPGFDQLVAESVRDGKIDMAMVPARAWDTLAAAELQALQAPFLITSDAVLANVVRSDAADRMLAGLDKIGVVGLALLP